MGMRIVCVALVAVAAAACKVNPAGNPVWVDNGPGPIHQGQVEGIPNRPVAGAVYCVAPHPNDPDVLFVGTEGGVWRTRNARAVAPSWTPLTDSATSLAVASLAFGRFDKELLTLYAGTGSRSSGSFRNPAVGVYKTVDGGDTWTELGNATLAGSVIQSLVCVSKEHTTGGEWLLAGTPQGIFHSQDAGVTWTSVLAGNVDQIAADRRDPDIYYAVTPGTTGQQLWISQDAGLTWTAQANSVLPGGGVELRVAVGAPKESDGPPSLWVATATGTSCFVARSLDRGQSWTMPVPPTTNELFGGGVVGPFPGGQAATGHFSLAADPSDPDVVYLGGDRQAAIPSSSLTGDWSGRLFVGDLGQSPVWKPLVGSFASMTSPHADSRCIAFDAAGDLLQGDDGGLYRMRKPDDESTRKWDSRNGNLRLAQIYSVALDPVNDCLFAGTQDMGSVEQVVPTSGGILWRDARLLGVLNIDLLNAVGDGGTVGVDASGPGYARRFIALNNAGFFFYRDFAVPTPAVIPAWLQFGAVPAPSLPQSGLDPSDNPLPAGFVRFPFAVNAINPSRLAIGMNAMYESFDSGASVRVVDPPRQGVAVRAVAYGGRFTAERPQVMYVARGNELSLREDEVAIWSRRLIGATTFGNGSGAIRDIVIDPLSWRIAYLVTRDRVFRIQRAGLADEQVVELTGNLSDLKTTNDAVFNSAGGINLQAVEIYVGGEPNALLVGGQGGVYRLLYPEAFDGTTPPTWTRFGEGLPNTLVTDLTYSAQRDRLVAATWGRGVWTIPSASKSLPIAKYVLDL